MDNSKLPLKAILISGISIILLLIVGLTVTVIILISKEEVPRSDYEAPTAQIQSKQEDQIRQVKEKKSSQEVQSWNAKVVAHEIPPQMKSGERRLVKITVENIGELAWDISRGDKFGLRAVDYTHLWRDADDNLQMENIVTTKVLPGDKYEFRFPIKAPEKAGEIPFHWRMYRSQSNQAWNLFGEEIKVTVVSY